MCNLLFTDTATTEIYTYGHTLFLHDALPISEAAMRAIIEAEHPGDGIIGEEYGNRNPGAGRQWVLDPIAGTTSFIAGRPIFGTLIALMQDGWPVVGGIAQTVLKERWLGVVEDGRASCRERV